MNRKILQRQLRLYPRTSTIGIDVSDHIIRAVFTRCKGKLAQVLLAIEIPVPEGLIHHGVITDHEQFRTLVIAKLLPHIKPSKATVVVSLPESHCFLRTVVATPDTLNQEIQRHLPFPIDDVLVDTCDHGPVDTMNASHLYSIAAAKTNVAQAYWDVFQGAGYHLRALEIESQGIARALYPSETGPLEHTVIIADIGKNHTTFLAIQQGHIDFTHTISSLSGKQLTSQIQELFHCTEQEAEQKKHTLVDQNSGIAPLIKQYTDELALELHRVIDFHSEHAPIHRANADYSLITVGGGSHLLSLKEHVEDSVRYPIHQGQLHPSIVCRPAVDPLSFLTAIGHSLRPFRPL